MTPLYPTPHPSPSRLIVGLSGLSASGKTTIATHLLALFPTSTLIHVDDFYKPESQLPLRAGHRDWDCAAALDLPALCACLTAWHRDDSDAAIALHARPPQGIPPPDNAPSDPELAAAVARLRVSTPAFLTRLPVPPHLLIVDGFLLFPPSLAPLPSLFAVKILLRATQAAARARRDARGDFVTLDGFWADPPGYFDHVVWPGWVEGHGRYFVGGDVEGAVDGEVCAREGVRVGGLEMGLGEGLEWVVAVLRQELGRREGIVEGLGDREREGRGKVSPGGQKKA